MTCQLHICARCAHEDKTCCQTCEVYATPGDVERIAQFLGEEDFTEFVIPENPIYYQFADDPIWREAVFREDGSRRILKRHANGDCRFLGSRGCTLPVEVRPLVCRLYPFDFNEQGIYDNLAKGCPTHLLEPGETLLVALDMNRVAADRWHAQLYREVRHEPHFLSSQSANPQAQAASPQAIGS